MTISTHTYTAELLRASPITLGAVSGGAGLDVSRAPHVEGSVKIKRPSASLMAALDPRQSPAPRVRVNAAAEFPSFSQSRAFDLTVRGWDGDQGAEDLTLSLASDEALAIDYAPTATDNTSRMYQASLRAVCDYALGLVPGITPNLAPSPRGDATTGWGATQDGAGSPAYSVSTSATVSPVELPFSTFLRVEATAPSTRLQLRAGASYNYLRAPMGDTATVSAWVRANNIVGAFTVNVALYQYDASGAAVGGTTTQAFTGVRNRWERVSVTAALHPAAVRIVPQFAIIGTIATGDLMLMTGMVAEQAAKVGPFRDYVLTPGVVDANMTAYWEVQNLLINPSGEGGTAGWALGLNATGLAASTAQKFVGNNSIAYASSAAGSANLRSEAMRVTPLGLFSASVYLRATSARPAALQIRWLNDAGTVISTSSTSTFTLSTSAWTRISIIGFTAPIGATQAYILTEYQASAAGQTCYVDGAMFYEGDEGVPYFDGSTAETPDYFYWWAGNAHGSVSRRIPVVERPLDMFTWEAGRSAFDFLNTIVQAAGMRLVCDENRAWTLRDESFRAAGTSTIRYGINMTSGADRLSRDSDLWFDAAVVIYRWRDARTGVDRERIDSWALPGATRTRTFERNVPYPGRGFAQYLVRRAKGRGREVQAGKVADLTATTEQNTDIRLLGIPIQVGIAEAVRFDFDRDEITVTTRTTDTPAGAIDLLQGTVDSLTGTINAL